MIMKVLIESDIEYYGSDGNRRNSCDIISEIDEKRVILKNWVNTLPENINKGKVI